MKHQLTLIIIGILLFSCSRSQKIKVGIQPLGDFDKSITDTVLCTLNKTYGTKCYLLERKELPNEAFINLKSPRYRADKILNITKKHKPDSLDYIVTLTNKDISTTKKDKYGNTMEPKSKYLDWGVFGLAYGPGPSCVVSTFRLKNTSENRFINRLKKVAIHELGHNLGLDHCISDLCVMRDAAETIKTIDFVTLELCEKCRRKIKQSL